MRINHREVVQARSAVAQVREELSIATSVKAPLSYIEQLQANFAKVQREAIRVASIYRSQQSSVAV